MKKLAVALILIVSLGCFGDVFTSHVKPTNDSALDIGTSSLLWRYIYSDAFSDGTATWSGHNLTGFNAISSISYTDGVLTISNGQITGLTGFVSPGTITANKLIVDEIELPDVPSLIDFSGPAGTISASGSHQINVEDPIIIDATADEAFLVRQNNDTDDVFIVDTTNKTVEVMGRLGLGVEPVANKRIHIWAEATDDYIFYIDHATRPLDNNLYSTAYGIYMDYDIEGAGNAVSSDYYGRNTDLDVTGSDIADATSTTDYVYGDYSTTSDGRTISPTTATTPSYLSYGVFGQMTAGQTITACADTTYTVGNCGGYFYADYDTEINDAGSTVTGDNVAGIFVADATGQTETAGTSNVTNYGISIDVDGETISTGNMINCGAYISCDDDAETNYGIFLKDEGSANTTWSLYSESTANSCFAGKLRVGATTAPTYELDVTGKGRVTPAAADDYILYLDHGTNDIDTAATDTAYGIYLNYDISGSGNASSTYYSADQVDLDVTGTDTAEASGSIDDLYGNDITITDSRTISPSSASYPAYLLYGSYSQANADQTFTSCDDTTYLVYNYGSYFYGNYDVTTNDAGSTVSGENYGAFIKADAAGQTRTSGTATIYNYGVFIDVDGETIPTGDMANYGVMIKCDDDAETNYAIFIDDMGSANTTWSLYSESTANSAFAGKLRIGSVVAPTVELDVTGDITASGTIKGGTLTDDTFSTTAGVMTGIASLDGGGTIDLEDNLDGTGFTITGGTLTDGVATLTGGAFTGLTNLTVGDIIIDEAAGVLDFTGGTSATISSTGAGLVKFDDDVQLNAGENIGMGIAPDANQNITIQSAAADDRFLVLDHGTNDVDVANTPKHYSIDIDVDVSGSGYAGSEDYYGLNYSLALTGTDTADLGFIDNNIFAGDSIAITDSRTLSPSAGTGMSVSHNYYGYYSFITDTKTYTNCLDKTYYENMTGNYFITNLTPTLNDAGSTITGNVKGVHVVVNGAATETAGTINMDAYGCQIDVDNKTYTGTSNNYGIYLDVDDDADTNYGLYIKDTGTANTFYPIYNLHTGNSLIGVDNAQLMFGTGMDARIYYDATDLIINAMAVGTGVVRPQSNRTLTGNVTDSYVAGIALDPGYAVTNGGNYTVTRHNYLNIEQPSETETSGTITITDAAVMRFDAAAGTHKAVDSGTTHPDIDTTDAWVKININGTIYYIPAYTDKS